MIAATESVKGISKDNLNELRSFAKPSINIVIALEPVVALITGNAKKIEWVDIKAEMKKDSFIQTVMNFNKDSIQPKVRNFI